MSPNPDKTVENSVFSQMTPDEAREDLLLRLRAEIDYLDSQVSTRSVLDSKFVQSDLVKWVAAFSAIILGYAIAGLIAGHLMIEVIKRAKL